MASISGLKPPDSATGSQKHEAAKNIWWYTRAASFLQTCLDLKMTRRQIRFLAPLILLAYLLAQNGLALLQVIEKLAGHQVVSSWHMGHYDVVVNHDQQPVPDTEASCATSCDQYQHIDFKPLNSATPDAKSKSLLVLFLALIPTLLVWFLPLLRRQVVTWPLFVHRNTLPLLIRSTVLRH